MVNTASGLATFGPQTPNRFGEVNPKIVRLSPHQGEEHLDADGFRQLLTLKRERREELPFDQGQGVDFGVHSGVLVFAFRAGDDGAASAETTAEGHQFAHAHDNHFVLELPGELAFLVFAQRVIKRHEQAKAGRVNVLAGDDLVFDQTLLPDVFIGPITGD
jgi:hypothetical protein